MPIGVKNWIDEANPLGPPANSGTATPVSAAALEDLETRMGAYMDSIIALHEGDTTSVHGIANTTLLAAIAAVSFSAGANYLPYFTSPSAAAVAQLSPFVITLLDDFDGPTFLGHIGGAALVHTHTMSQITDAATQLGTLPKRPVTASTTFALADIGKVISCNHGSIAIDVAIPLDATLTAPNKIPVDAIGEVYRKGAAAVSVSIAAPGVIENAATGATTQSVQITSKYGSCSLRQGALDTWVADGRIQ